MPGNKGTVLYIGGFELPDRNPAAHRVLNNAKILKTLGYNVVFCGVDKEITVSSEKADLISGFESYPIPYPKSNKQWVKQMLDISCYSNIISKYADIKIVICYNLHAVPLAKILKLAKTKGFKVVADCTEWYENKFSLNPIKLIKSVDTYLCMCHYQKKCDGMIAISNFLGNYYKKYIKNTIVLPPLVDLDDPKYQTDNIGRDNITTICYSGNPAALKEALGDVVRSLNKFDDLQFIFKVVGITKESFIQIYGIEPNDKKIEFLGRVPHINALNTVKNSDYSVIIRPKSRITSAGFPTKFSEAISCNTAVIANDTSDLADYLKDGKNGHLVSLDNLESDLRYILSQKEKPIVVRRIFDYHNWTAKIEQLLENLKV